MAETVTRPARALHALAEQVLIAAGVSSANAASTASALVAADLNGIASHGLSRVPFYADQVASGKLDGKAVLVVVRKTAAVLQVDACDGFAYPAIELALIEGQRVAREAGLAAVAITRSHHCGALGIAVERAAEAGLIALFFANSPAAIAPWGGHAALFGTNPVAFGLPRKEAPPLVIDLSLSVAARGKIMLAAERGQSIPEGWALDDEGRPTTDAAAALKGTMMPLGGAKGAALALMVELLAAGLTRANFGHQASSFFDAKGPPPRVGQLLLLFDPAAFGGDAMLKHCEDLLTAIADQSVRLPGERRQKIRARLEAEGITLPRALFDDLERRAMRGK
jgi:(2R)-3-sulfolactate dehydrogenase (NADP+)